MIFHHNYLLRWIFLLSRKKFLEIYRLPRSYATWQWHPIWRRRTQSSTIFSEKLTKSVNICDVYYCFVNIPILRKLLITNMLIVWFQKCYRLTKQHIKTALFEDLKTSSASKLVKILENSLFCWYIVRNACHYRFYEW